MKRLFAAAAFAPLCFAATGVYAQTTISTARTTPVATSTAADVEITSTGSVTVSDGAAVTIDSDNILTTNGPINVRNSSSGTGVLVAVPTTGRKTTIVINNNINADDVGANPDNDRDGDGDGPFAATGVRRFGIRVTGTGSYIGDLGTAAGSIITVEGTGGSAGIYFDTGIVGNITLNGLIATGGTDGYGFRMGGPVDGKLDIGGTINAQGQGAVGVALEGPVTGLVKIDGAITATGFRYTDRLNLPTRIEFLDADDLLIGGSALKITADLNKGLMINAPPEDRDASNNDEDGDGIPDSDETRGVVSAFGSAPALLIGAADRKLTIGGIPDGSGLGSGFGIEIGGQVIGSGVYNGVNATGAMLGVTGGTLDIAGGVRISGQVNAAANRGDALGLLIGHGTKTPLLLVDTGTISAGVDQLGANGGPLARAVLIAPGAQVPQLINNGTIKAGVTGGTAAVYAVNDQSGTLSSITNLGTVSAEITTGDIDVAPKGPRVAFDLLANTSGVTFTQTANGNSPSIVGDILLGAGAANDVLTFNAGSNRGAIDFGGGDDVFTLAAGTTSRTDLRKSAGKLNMSVGGNLTLTNTRPVRLETLDVKSTAAVTFTADPRNPDGNITFLNVAGDATLEAGSAIDVEFISKLPGRRTFEILRAGNLINRGVNTDIAAELPFLFTGTANVRGNSIFVDARPRTARELGLRGGRADAFDAFYAAFDADPGVARAVFAKRNAGEFGDLFDQFLPDYSGGPFNALANGVRAVYQAQAEEAKNMTPGEPRSWLQEVGVGTKFESVNDIEYQTGGFGVAAGFEKPLANNTVYGFSGSFVSSEIRNANRFLGSLLTGSVLMSGVYWRGQEGGMIIDASASGGYAWYDSDRRIVDQNALGVQNLVRQASAEWSGALLGGRAGVTYEWTAGNLYIKHDAVLDAVYLREGGYVETGGGAGVNLGVSRRETYEIAAEAGILLGAQFGRSFRWGPELRVAYRSALEGGEGDTTGWFISAPNQPFILPGLMRSRHRVVVRAALRGAGAYSNFAFEASGDLSDNYKAYMARFVVRFLF